MLVVFYCHVLESNRMLRAWTCRVAKPCREYGMMGMSLRRASFLRAICRADDAFAFNKEAPAGECELRFLMVNSNSFHLRFPEATTIREVKQALIDRKPPELMDFLQNSSPSSPPPSKTEELRILHLGRFLEDAKTLEGK